MKHQKKLFGTIGGLFLFLVPFLVDKEINSQSTKQFEQQYAKFVGVGTMLVKDQQVLMFFRKNTGRNDDKYGLIGDLVQPHETVLQAAIREVFEETGVQVKPEDMKLVHIISSYENNTEVVGCYFYVEKWDGEPYNKASHKHDHIAWFDLDDLPENLIERNRMAIEYMKKQISYSEYWITE